MEKIFKETILISTKHISNTSLWYTHIRKILQRNYKILEIMQTHLQGILDTTIQEISETYEISEV